VESDRVWEPEGAKVESRGAKKVLGACVKPHPMGIYRRPIITVMGVPRDTGDQAFEDARQGVGGRVLTPALKEVVVPKANSLHL